MAWILTITKNLCLKCIRSSQRRVSLSDEEWSFSPPDEFESSADDRIMLSACMSSLNDIERQIVVLHAVSGMKHREIRKLLSLVRVLYPKAMFPSWRLRWITSMES